MPSRPMPPVGATGLPNRRVRVGVRLRNARGPNRESRAEEFFQPPRPAADGAPDFAHHVLSRNGDDVLARRGRGGGRATRSATAVQRETLDVTKMTPVTSH